MINGLLMKLRPVAGGFDPVPSEHARTYAEHEWANINLGLVDDLEARLGGFRGKRVLDLGAGPGRSSFEFARRGARVVWHDVSRNYLNLARDKAGAIGADIRFELGYLEEAAKYADEPFDFVFNRICWFYCTNDFNFARIFHRLIRPGGSAYIDNYMKRVPGGFPLRIWINAYLGIKIGHVLPPPGRLEKLFGAHADIEIEVISRSEKNEKLFLTRKGPDAPVEVG